MGPSEYTRKDARRVAHRDRPQPVSHSESEVTQLGSNMMFTRFAPSSGAGLGREVSNSPRPLGV